MQLYLITQKIKNHENDKVNKADRKRERHGNKA